MKRLLVIFSVFLAFAGMHTGNAVSREEFALMREWKRNKKNIDDMQATLMWQKKLSYRKRHKLIQKIGSAQERIQRILEEYKEKCESKRRFAHFCQYGKYGQSRYHKTLEVANKILYHRTTGDSCSELHIEKLEDEMRELERDARTEASELSSGRVYAAPVHNNKVPLL